MKKRRKKQGGSVSHDVRGLFNHAPPKKRNKFGAIKTTVYGIEFHSKHEAERYVVLRALANAGRIHCLAMQVPYNLAVNGMHIAKYIADFEYLENGELVTEDAKGHRTPEYKLKKKLMKAIHDITIRET